MGAILKVINKCIVIEFYKQNAAFFGFVILVFFGFIRSEEHLAIGSFLVANPSALFFLYVLWFGYAVKIILFILPALNKKENRFLVSFYLFPSKTKITAVGSATFLLLTPVVIYSAFLITLAISNVYYYWSIFFILFGLLTFTAIIALILLRRLNNLPKEKSLTHIGFFNKIAKPPYSFFIEHLIRNEPILLLLTKFYSCLLLIGTSALYTTDEFDLRLLSTGVLLAFVGNVAILNTYVWFSHAKMAFSKNLPIPFVKLLKTHFITLIILIVPEFLVMIRHYPMTPNLLDISGTVLFGFSLTTLMYGLQLIKQAALREFITVLFWVVVMMTILILFSIHPMILASLCLFISVSIVYFRHHQFEFVDKTG